MIISLLSLYPYVSIPKKIKRQKSGRFTVILEKITHRHCCCCCCCLCTVILLSLRSNVYNYVCYKWCIVVFFSYYFHWSVYALEFSLARTRYSFPRNTVRLLLLLLLFPETKKNHLTSFLVRWSPLLSLYPRRVPRILTYLPLCTACECLRPEYRYR